MDLLLPLRRLLAWLFRRPRADRMLPEPSPLPGTLAFVGLEGGDMSDLKLFGWLKHLQAEVPFPQPAYGRVEPPATPAELMDRLVEAHRALEEAVTLAASRERPTDDGEPEWFVVLADRIFPLMCWYVGLGLPPTTVAVPQGLIDLMQKVKKLNVFGDRRVSESIDGFREQLERARSRHVEMQSANLAVWQVQLQALLAPLVDHASGSVSVSFDFPATGARIADLVPPPAEGSPTSGVVTRVLVPSLAVALTAPKPGVAREAVALSRGAHVR